MVCVLGVIASCYGVLLAHRPVIETLNPLMMQHSHLVALKPRREAVWRSKCRPPRRKRAVKGEVVCVLGTTASGRVCCSHANPLLRVGTRYIARKPASWSVGGIAQAQNSRPACGSEDPRSE